LSVSLKWLTLHGRDAHATVFQLTQPRLDTRFRLRGFLHKPLQKRVNRLSQLFQLARKRLTRRLRT
jgi:hypothetical protein